MLLLPALAAAGSLVLLAMSVYPGLIDDVLFIIVLLSPLWLPVALLAGVIFLVVLTRGAGSKPAAKEFDLSGDGIGTARTPGFPWNTAASMIGVVVVSLVLVGIGMPMRIGFALSRRAFEREVAAAPASSYGGMPMDRRLGVYRVDQYAADPRGGVYFRTHASYSSGPDTFSYGFAFRPNSGGTPFGDHSYSLSRMSGDWYAFAATDD